MKRLLFAALMVFYAITLPAQQIEFHKENWDQVLQKAKKSNKIVFLDAYTTWCGPCKKMSKHVFTNERVAKYYNETYVNAKFDMERGEGLEIAKKYEIKAYPTLLFIDGDGEVVHKAVGSKSVDEFIQLGRDAANPKTRSTTVEAAYKGGDRSDEVVLAYARLLDNKGDIKGIQIINDYLKDKNWDELSTMKIIAEFAVPSSLYKTFRHVKDNKERYLEMVDPKRINYLLEMGAMNDGEIMGINVMSPTDTLTKFYASYVGQDKARKLAIKFYVSEINLIKNDQKTSLLRKLDNVLKDPSEFDHNFYNEIAWKGHKKIDDPELLETTLKWANISIDKNMNAQNTDTKAAILYSQKKKKEALQWAKVALALADIEGSDAQETKDLIEKIKKLD